MNLDYSAEQQMLKDSVARYILKDYDFQLRRKHAASETGFSREQWQTFAELGWLSIPFAEEYKGYGGNIIDVIAIMEEFGKGLVIEPYITTVLLFGGLLVSSNNKMLQHEHIAGIISGEVQGAFAWHERQSRFDTNNIQTSATKDGHSYLLNGSKTVVFNGAVADQIIVTARTSGSQTDTTGITLFMIDANAEGLSRSRYRLMDGQLVADVTLNKVRVPLEYSLGQVDQGHALMTPVIEATMVASCAQALGIMQALNEVTIEYTKTRKQFGVAIASFQALQHRMVDMFMAAEQTRSLLYRAACSLEQAGPDSGKDVLALKVMSGRSGKLIGDEAIQLHGGMGMTDELAVGHYVKRLMMLNTLFGDADHQQQKFMVLTDPNLNQT